MSPRRYTIALLAALLLLLGSAGAFNRIVDPFWYFRDVEIRGFNLDKPRFPRNERLVKSALVTKFRPEAVILGSSYAEVGLPATHAGFTGGGRLKPYNLSVSGGAWPEIHCYALFALAQPGLKRMVLGASGSAAASCSGLSNLGEVDYAKLLFSQNALSASWETLRRQDGKPRVTAEGMWYFKRFEEKIRGDEDIAANFASELRSHLCQSPQRDRGYDAGLVNRSKPPADASTAGLRGIVRLALQKKVRLVLLVYPKHVLHYELERRCGELEARWNQLWKLVSLVEEEAGPDSPLVEVWDFYGYREVNAERVRAGIAMPKRLWQDAGHFNHEVGAAAFDTIFFANRSGLSGYGRRVNTRDFDRYIDESESERRAFLLSHAWVKQELDELTRPTHR